MMVGMAFFFLVQEKKNVAGGITTFDRFMGTMFLEDVAHCNVYLSKKTIHCSTNRGTIVF